MYTFLTMRTAVGLLVSSIFFAACATPKAQLRSLYRGLSTQEKQDADSIIHHGLNHEALYTLADSVKPMSSLKMYRLPLLSKEKRQQDSALQALMQLQSLANKLSENNGFVFVLNPFRRADSIYKNVELYVVRRSALAKKITEYASFYAGIGLNPLASPATVLAFTEYEQMLNRWRSYGYLFGYPGHAVDFFVEAGRIQDSSKQFVTRDFFHIPVAAGVQGHFTYAVPKGYLPTAQDSALYKKSLKTLDRFRKMQEKNAGRKGFRQWIKMMGK